MDIVSFLNSVAQDMEENKFNFMEDGKCSNCGKCCSNMLFMTQKEIRAIHDYIVENHVEECKHLLPLSDDCRDMTCPFRDDSNRVCTIYPVRPEICRQFICDSEKRKDFDNKGNKQPVQLVMVREEFFNEDN